MVERLKYASMRLLFHLTQYVFELLRLYVIEPKKMAMLAMNLTSQSR